MTRRTGRYRFVLVEEPESYLPVRYRPPRRPPPPLVVRRADPMEILLEAFWRLSQRGEGVEAWAPALGEDPLAFLLDAIGDPVTLRERSGRLVYSNPAARGLALPDRVEPNQLEVLKLAQHRYERRCMQFGAGRHTLVLEVLRRMD